MGYVNRGVGATAPRPGGPRFIPVPRARYRGFGLIRGLGQTCPAGQVATPQYDGSTKCCGAPGTPPAADPCSILNNPSFLAAQAADVGPLGPNGVPLSAGNGPGAAELASIAGYPNSVQTDAIDCWNNPGLLYVDAMGKTISCPAPSVNMNGILVSAYTPAQLAAMISGGPPQVSPLAGNQPFATPAQVYGGPSELGVVSSSPGEGVVPTVRLVNTSGGSNSTFNPGDSWQIIVTGAPNAQVTASSTQNGTSVGSSTPMGTIGSNGQLVLTGAFAASQAGNWVENWRVGNVPAGSISFSVASGSGGASSPSGSGGGATSNGGGSSSSSSSTNSNPFGFLTNSFQVGGVSIPIWAAGGAAVLAFFMFTGKR